MFSCVLLSLNALFGLFALQEKQLPKRVGGKLVDDLLRYTNTPFTSLINIRLVEWGKIRRAKHFSRGTNAIFGEASEHAEQRCQIASAMERTLLRCYFLYVDGGVQ